jgi:hypothetical protein
MGEDFLKGSNKDRRSGRDRRSELCFERSAETKFLHGKVRFVPPSELAIAVSKSAGDVVANHNTWKESADRRSGSECRSGRDRRSGFDSRSEIGRFLQGERRSGLDRRSKGGYRSFKKARAFIRGLGLKSVPEWRNYIIAGLKPDDIPRAPHHVYANDSWAGSSDWLGTAATY